MKYRLLITLLSTVISIIGYSQEVKKNQHSQTTKEDRHNLYQSDKISKLDILQGLEVAGIGINKFYLGEFDQKYDFLLMVDEYVNGEVIDTDTIIDEDNVYHYYESGTEDYFLDYIDQLKIFTKEGDGKSEMHISTYEMSTKKELVHKIEYEDQFYTWRNYSNSLWKLNKKIPLIVLASSWKDKKHGFQRFCGVVRLTEGDERTEELLTSSPHYYVVYYMVKN